MDMPMRVPCDLCGVEPAAVICCADDAALCYLCDFHVYRANVIARRHSRLTLINPSYATNDAAAPLCNVCKEQRRLMFYVDGRSILSGDCDCDEPTSKLSVEPVEQAIPSPDGSPYEHDESVNSHDASHGGEEEEEAAASSTEALS